MPYNEGMLEYLSAPAGVDLSGKQFYGVSLVPDADRNPPGVKAALGVATKAISGILQNNPLQGQAALLPDQRDFEGGDQPQPDDYGRHDAA